MRSRSSEYVFDESWLTVYMYMRNKADGGISGSEPRSDLMVCGAVGLENDAYKSNSMTEKRKSDIVISNRKGRK